MLDKLAQEIFPQGITQDGINKLEEQLKNNQVDPAAIQEIKETLTKQMQTQQQNQQQNQTTQPTNTTQTTMQPGKSMNKISVKDLDVASRVFEFIKAILEEPKKATANSHQVTPDMLCVEFGIPRDLAHKTLKIYSIGMAQRGKGKEWALEKLAATFNGIDFEKAEYGGESQKDNPYKGKDSLLEVSHELGVYKAQYNFLLGELEAKNMEIADLRERISDLEDELMGPEPTHPNIDFDEGQ